MIYPKLDALYKELHAHPELAFQEVKTAARLAAEMRALGFDVTENIGKTGLVAIYRNGDGPTIMVRTELDGLPMEEKTGLDYASRDKTNWNGREVFVAHSCGHDIHMASWVGTAKTLLGLKDEWKRHADVHRPARRRSWCRRHGDAAGGSVHAISKTRFWLCLARNWRLRPRHRALYRRGRLLELPTASTSNFAAFGGHGAMPQATIDPVMMAARFVVDVQSVISREKDPTEFGVVSIGTIQGGTAANIIPDEVVLTGTIRSFKPEVRAKMLAGIERTAKAVAAMSNAPEPLIMITEGIKAVMNDPGVVATAEKVLKAGVRRQAQANRRPSRPAKIISEFISAGVPSMFFRIGVYEPERVAAAREGEGPPLPANHSPLFAPVPTPTIETGITAMTLAVLSAFDQKARQK